MTRYAWVAGLALVAGCGGDAQDSPARAPVYLPLDDVALARRASVDLRGVVPTVDELARARDGELPALVEEWLVDPRYETHLVDVLAEEWELRLDAFVIGPEEFGTDLPVPAMTRAFGDEAARLMAHVAATDRPWTEIVTADWTMANDALAELSPLTFTGDAPPRGAWAAARYTDGRPAGGILMTSGLWLRHTTTLFNYNRGRANLIARMLLCQDFLVRPVHFVRLESGTTEAIEDAVRNEPACVACHAALDPLASSLFGFFPFEDHDATELVNYHPERERAGEQWMDVAPGWYGTPIDGAAQLGPMVARDPRFAACAVRRTAERLWGVAPEPDALDELIAVEAGWTADGQRQRDLVRAMLATERYRAGAFAPHATDAERARAATVRVMSPSTLASVVEDLTGFRWTAEGWDLLDSDVLGFRVLLGGVDGHQVRQPNRRPTTSSAIVRARLAEAAASWAVGHDLDGDPRARTLFSPALADLRTPGGGLATELAYLHTRILGAAPTDEERTELVTFWTDAARVADPREAWAGTVGLLLRDPRAWTY